MSIPCLAAAGDEVLHAVLDPLDRPTTGLAGEQAGDVGTSGAAPAADESAEAAARAYADGQWAAAASGYEALVEANPDDARSRFRLAVSLRQLGRLEASSEQLDQAQAGGVPAAFVEPERARLRLAQGDRPGAVAALAVPGSPNPRSSQPPPSKISLSKKSRL